MVTSKRDTRIKHWEEIKKGVTTHEGEHLTGAKGDTYQKKWGEKMLGKPYKKTNYGEEQYQRELDRGLEGNR